LPFTFVLYIKPCPNVPSFPRSVNLNVPKNNINKPIRRDEPKRPAKQAHGHALKRHVPEVEARLQKACHVRLAVEVVEAVEEDVEPRSAAGDEGGPLPVVVLGIKKEIYGDNRGAHGHDGQDHVNEHHESVDVIELVVPVAREDEVELDEDGPEGQDPGEGNHEVGVPVPGGVGDGAGDGVNTTGEVGLAPEVAPEHGPDYCQGHGDEAPYPKHLEDNHEGHGVDGSVVECDAVEDGQHGDHDHGEAEDRQAHGELPPGASLSAGRREELTVVSPGLVAGNDRGEGVADDEGG
jgi:hypothetical protein